MRLSSAVAAAALLTAGLVARPTPARAQSRPVPGSLPGVPAARPDSVRADSIRSDRARRDSAGVDSLGRRVRLGQDTAFDALRDLDIALQARMESKLERARNERCVAGQAFALSLGCSSPFQPNFDFQFNVRTDGSVADRLRVNVDYDSQREFDASNNISLFYEGKPGARLGRLEVGNVSFTPTPSRFITAGVPSNNLGAQALGQIGRVRWRAIAAQQRGNVITDRVFTVGGATGTVQTVTRPIEDFAIEPRRFFFTIDPRLLPGYPNVDVLNRAQMARLAAQLPDTLRPTRVFLYRQLVGAQQQNPRGPRPQVRGSRVVARQTYELLRENVDYYVDPSQLWVALVRPLGLNNERLAVAYEVTVGGQRTRHERTGGTPDVEFTEAPQFANLVWEPELAPNDSAFSRELRNVYRVGGEDVRRETVSLAIATGAAGDQQAPADPAFGATYLQLFGLAQANNPAVFDVENRLWPRPQDPNVNAAGTQLGAKLIRDYFVIFPSAQPFARAGLARPAANPANDTIYTFPNEFLYSAQRPRSVYRLQVRYESEGGGGAVAADGGPTLMLGAVQLRPASERLVAAGRVLARGVDYTIDYELGMVTFLRAESLFPTATDVTVKFEENPLFGAQPTNVFGAAAELPTRAGSVFFTALSQTQRSAFNRPPVGFEQRAGLVAGVSADLAWNAPLLTRLTNRLTALSRAAGDAGAGRAGSRVTLRGEVAASRPLVTRGMQAYVESFEGGGGVSFPTGEGGWYYASRPTPGAPTGALARRGLTQVLVPERAATLAWQSNVTAAVGGRTPKTFTIDSIDPAIRLTRGGVATPEPVFWLSLFPLRVGGLPAPGAAAASPAAPFRWTVPNAPAGRRWRSIRTLLNAGGAGVDLSRVETLEFYALVYDPSGPQARRNPTLVFDFGDVSENSLAFAPETLTVTPGADAADTAYTGRRPAGLDRIDTERDTLSRTFNAAANDVGLPGDRADAIVVREGAGAPRVEGNVPLCRAQLGVVRALGDPLADCTRENSRLDEEDIDQDGTLSLTEGNERLRRYVVDLADTAAIARYTEACTSMPLGLGDAGGAGAAGDRRCWVQVRMPFRAATDSIGAFNERRVRALRLTMISGEDQPDDAFTRLALARLRLTGAPWLKRADRVLTGVAGDSLGAVGSYVVASLVGTQDSSESVPYQSPPGVIDEPEQLRTGLEPNRAQINERSLRLQAGVPGGSIGVFERAEAYFRFPEGVKSVMTYRQLRLWARGASSGWGPGGELNVYVKLGRDEHNFYMYRADANAGPDRNAWLPELRVDFERFYRLRLALQESYLRGGAPGSGRYECRGVDAELVRRSGLPRGLAVARYAACDGGYMIYTVDPNVTPPNLSQLQEIAVGFVRVDSLGRGANPVLAGDTLELWVDDVRLAEGVDAPGVAGEVALTVQAGDLAEVRVGFTRRDPNFRQIGEAPSFVTANDLTLAASVRLDRLMPRALGLALPFTVTHAAAAAAPVFVTGSDLRGSDLAGLRTPRDAVTTYALTVRRAEPLPGGPLALLVNNLSLTSTYVAGRARSAFQGTSRNAFSLRADYDLGAAALSLGAPGGGAGSFGDSLGASLGAPTRPRWAPTALRLTSHLARSGTRQEAFLKPVAAADDSGEVVTGLDHVWRHAALVEFQPRGALTARLDANTLRDLRDYADAPRAPGDTLDRAGAIARDRARLGALDLGFERERVMNGTLLFTPTVPRVSRWLRPRAEATTTYTMTRDPNARSLIGPGDLQLDSIAFADTLDAADLARLPRRLGATRLLSAGLALDVGRALLDRAGPDTARGRGLRRLAAVFRPLDLTVSRTLTSSFDATAADPGVGVQFGLGGLGSLREIDGRKATAAGLVDRVTVTNALALPFGVTLTNRAEVADTRTWWRRAFSNAQAEGEGELRTLPDVTARWSYRPAWAARVFSALDASAGLRRQTQTTRAPVEAFGSALGSALGDLTADDVDVRSTRVASYPLSAGLTWSLLGGLRTDGGVSLVRRDDELPGNRIGSTTRDGNFAASRAFTPPKRWGLKSNITTRGGFQRSRTRAIISPRTSLNAFAPVVQADTERETFSFSANSDVAESLTLSLTGNHVVTANNALNQRFSQTVLSAVLQLTFFSGRLR